MSFTAVIKQEVAYNSLQACCQRAELSALIQLTASLNLSEGEMTLRIRSENPTTAKRIMQLLKERYRDLKTGLLREQKTNLRKNNIYIIKVYDQALKILTDLGLADQNGLREVPSAAIIAKDCCKRAYLAGAFIAFGSCNAPERAHYHLEISLMSAEHAIFIIELLAHFNLQAKQVKRRNKWVVYLKKAEAISDFLRCIGAFEALLNFENARISRDFKNSLIRLDNCEIANEVKTLKAAKKQLETIQTLMENDGLKLLDEKLKTVLDLRLKNPEASLFELSVAYQKYTGEVISRSGLKHRFNKLAQIADELVNAHP